MPKTFHIIFFSLIILFSAGCKKNHVPSDEQQIFFQMDYINYAWGYQHYGFLIDAEGYILTYDNPEKWNFTDSNYNLTDDQMAENISMCMKSGVKLPVEEVAKYAAFISNIASSKITAIRNSGADAGSLQFICYRFRENSPVYRGSLIKMEGDFSCENLNFYSKKVIAWMKDINENLPQ